MPLSSPHVVRLTLAGLAASSLAACSPAAPPADATARPAVVFTEAAWKPPREADIPNDSMGASIRRGLALLRFTPESLPAFATSKLRCTSCHQDDGLKATAAPLTGSHARFPKYMARTGQNLLIGLRKKKKHPY